MSGFITSASRLLPNITSCPNLHRHGEAADSPPPVAARGGSRLVFRDNLFNTGPESAGAESGPTCYRYFSLGYSLQTLRVLQDGRPIGRYRREPVPRPADHGLFPRIFGKSEKEPLDFTAGSVICTRSLGSGHPSTGSNLFGFVAVHAGRSAIHQG